jgi:hypothetical protein
MDDLRSHSMDDLRSHSMDDLEVTGWMNQKSQGG